MGVPAEGLVVVGVVGDEHIAGGEVAARGAEAEGEGPEPAAAEAGEGGLGDRARFGAARALGPALPDEALVARSLEGAVEGEGVDICAPSDG